MPDSTIKKPNHGHLTLWICIAIVAAIVIALLLPKFSMSMHLGGEIFLRLLKMIVVPLVITSVLSGILGLGDVRKLGNLAWRQLPIISAQPSWQSPSG